MTTILTYLLVLIEAVVSFLLISIILVQRSKSQGVGMAFGGGMGETLFGSQMGNVLTKTTIILGIIFLVNTTILAIMGSKAQSGVQSVTDMVKVKPPVQQTVPQPRDNAQIPPAAGQMPAVNMDDLPAAAPAADTTVPAATDTPQPATPATMPESPDSAAAPAK